MASSQRQSSTKRDTGKSTTPTEEDRDLDRELGLNDDDSTDNSGSTSNSPVSDETDEIDETSEAKRETQAVDKSHDPETRDNQPNLKGDATDSPKLSALPDEMEQDPTNRSEYKSDDDHDPFTRFRKESTSDLVGGYAFNADPDPLFRVPDLLNAEGVRNYLKSNYGVDVIFIPKGYTAKLEKEPEKDTDNVNDDNTE